MSSFLKTSAAVAKKTWFREKRIQSWEYEFQPDFRKSKFTVQNNVLLVILYKFTISKFFCSEILRIKIWRKFSSPMYKFNDVCNFA